MQYPPQPPQRGQQPSYQPNQRPQYPPQQQWTQYPQQTPYPPPYQQQYPPQQQYYQPMPPPILQPPPKKKGPSGCQIVLIVLGVLFAIGLIGAIANPQSNAANTTTSNTTDTSNSTSDAQPTDTPTPIPTPGLAYELASLDAGGNLSDGDPSIAKYQALLDNLHNKTGDSEQTIADETVKGQQILHDKGIDVKLLDLLESVNKAISSKSEHIHYAEALAALITLMTYQQ